MRLLLDLYKDTIYRSASRLVAFITSTFPRKEGAPLMIERCRLIADIANVLFGNQEVVQMVV